AHPHSGWLAGETPTVALRMKLERLIEASLGPRYENRHAAKRTCLHQIDFSPIQRTASQQVHFDADLDPTRRMAGEKGAQLDLALLDRRFHFVADAAIGVRDHALPRAWSARGVFAADHDAHLHGRNGAAVLAHEASIDLDGIRCGVMDRAEQAAQESREEGGVTAGNSLFHPIGL